MVSDAHCWWLWGLVEELHEVLMVLMLTKVVLTMKQLGCCDGEIQAVVRAVRGWSW